MYQDLLFLVSTSLLFLVYTP